MVAAAVIGSAVVGGAASSYAGSKAADASKDAAALSSDTQLQMYYQNRDDTENYRGVGDNALNQLASLYGAANDQYTQPMSYADFVNSDQYAPQTEQSIAGGTSSIRGQMLGLPSSTALSGPTSQEQYDQYVDGFQGELIPGQSSEPDFSSFLNSPDYKFAYDQGMRGTEQSLAKRGLTGSGAEMKALSQFNQGLASQQLNNYKNSLATLAGIGQTSTSQINQLGANTAASIGANQIAAGDARASSYLNTGAAVSNAANSYGQYSLMKAGGYLG